MTSGPENTEAAPEDIEAIRQVALDYVEGYLSGDAQRHGRSYHPEAIKRRYHQDENGVVGIISLSPQIMADHAALQTKPDSESHVEVIIDDVSQDIASVRVYSDPFVDYLHVVKARGEWKLLHVTWHTRLQQVPES